MAFIDEYQLVWPQKSYLGSVLECCPLNFIFPEKIDGALKDLFILAASFFCELFCSVAGSLHPKGPFCIYSSGPTFSESFICLLDFAVFWWLYALYYMNDDYIIWEGEHFPSCFHLSATV